MASAGGSISKEGPREKIDAKMIGQRAIERLFVHETFAQQRGVRGDALASRQFGGVLQQRHWNAQTGEKGDLRRQRARRGVLQPTPPAKAQAHRSGKRLHAAPVDAASLFLHSRDAGRNSVKRIKTHARDFYLTPNQNPAAPPQGAPRPKMRQFGAAAKL
jgi:hypothetical protein